MTQKKKIAKKLSTFHDHLEDSENFLWPWPHLPPALIHPPHTKLSLRHSAFGVTTTTKSWPTTSHRCKSTHHLVGQRLQLHRRRPTPPNPNTRGPPSRYFDDGTRIEEVVSQRSDASYWCVMEAGPAAVETEYCRGARAMITPPPNPRSPVGVGVALEDGGVPSSTLTVCYILYHDYRNAHIRYECTTPDPFDVKRKPIVFTSVVRCGGRFYAMSLQGTLVVMQVVDWRLRMTAVSATRAVPSVSSRVFSELLFELEGEVFVVFFIHGRSTETVDRVEVYGLCFDSLEWTKVERLGGRKVFVGKYSVNWAGSGEVECRGDCVYFTQGIQRRWWVYDMVSGQISPWGES